MYSCTVYERYEKLKNHFKAEVEPNSILPTTYHATDWLWFIATLNTLAFNAVCPQKQKETLIVNPPIVIIKLNMPFTATSSYLTLFPYYHDESK